MHNSSLLLDLSLESSMTSTQTPPTRTQPQVIRTVTVTTHQTEADQTQKPSNISSPTSVQLSFSPPHNTKNLSSPAHSHHGERGNTSTDNLTNILLPNSQEMERGDINPMSMGTTAGEEDQFLTVDAGECECDSVQSEEESPPFAINEEEVIFSRHASPGSDAELAISIGSTTHENRIDDVNHHHDSSSYMSSQNHTTAEICLSERSHSQLENIYDEKTQSQYEKCARGSSNSFSTLLHQHSAFSTSTNQPTTTSTCDPFQLDPCSSKGVVDSLKFSTLMDQADDKQEEQLQVSEEPSLLDHSSPYQVLPRIKYQSQSNSTSYEPMITSTTPIGRNYNRSRAVLEDISSNSFRVTITTSSGTNIRDAFDVVSNPELLRYWCESIDALIVIDHKGGSGGPSPTSSMYTTREQEEVKYVELPLEEFDDDMIVPPAEEQRSSLSTQRRPEREYEGEWIQASTSSIVPPHSHSNILDDCVKKTRDVFGFPYYGTVSMFIERNLNRVGFTVGPFKGGITLSHQIELKDAESKEEGVIITDEVKVMMKEEDEKELSSHCTCFEPLHGLMSEWLSPGMDGYIDQTQQSLLNLVWLIERGGENDYDGNLILASAEDGLRQPLLV